MSDPYSWGDYPSVSDLNGGVNEPTVEELRQEAVDAEDDRRSDADWGTES